MDGVEWQRQVTLWLRVRHKGDFQRVPDSNSGDWGLEGFSRKDGVAYQCYACKEPIPSKERYQKQRDKMTEDIQKFIANRTDLQRLFNGHRISQWVLAVPLCDNKELLLHAQKKRDEVLASALPYVHDDFQVLVQHEEDFASERAALASSAIDAMELRLGDWSDAAAGARAQAEPTLVERIATKLRKSELFDSDERLHRYLLSRLRQYVAAENALDDLRTRLPEVAEKLERDLQMIEVSVEAASQVTGPSDAHLRTITQRVEQAVCQLLGPLGVSASTSTVLVEGKLMEWLDRCPLDFAPPSDEGPDGR